MDENKMERVESFNFRERKKTKEQLDSVLYDIAKQINSEVSLVDNQGNQLPIVDEENCIEMRSFYTKVGGPHAKTQNSKIQDLHLVEELEKDFARVDDFSDSQARLEEWRESQKFDDAKLLESVVTILLHKALGPQYFVMKSSAYDDYINGVDTIVFSKYTGDIVCVFDEILGSEPLLNNDRYKQKIAHVTEAGSNDVGVNVKYGLTSDIVSEQYIRTEVTHVPLICLKINRDVLHKLLQQYDSVNSTKTDTEINILKKIIDDIQDQKENILQKSHKYQSNSNIQEIDSLLDQLKKHLE